MHHSAEACSRSIITVVHKASSGNRFSISNLDPNVVFFNRLCGSPKCTAKSSWFAQLDPLQTMDLLEDRAAMINLALPNPCHLGNENKRPVYLLCIGYFLATQWKIGLKHVNMWEMIVYKLVIRIPFLTKQHNTRFTFAGYPAILMPFQGLCGETTTSSWRWCPGWRPAMVASEGLGILEKSRTKQCNNPGGHWYWKGGTQCITKLGYDVRRLS